MSSVDHFEAAIDLGPSMRRTSEEIDELLEALLPDPPDQSRRLVQAMRYAGLGGGKRLRPLMTIASATVFGVPREKALRAGLAVECVHAHSLIHDDLPCMDDDSYRRGKPTVHRAFDEATAVLAGDALLALAFEILGEAATHPSGDVRAELIRTLASAAGCSGMAGGQMIDLIADAEGATIDSVTRLQRLKTGALIAWCAEAGAIMGNAPAHMRTSLRGYAQCVGLAFQIADDLLDAEGDEEAVGKPLRKDEARGKATFVSLLGVQRAREQAELLVAQAREHLHAMGKRARLLEAIAVFAINRRH